MIRSGLLVVEDNGPNRDVLARLLRRHGYEVATVADGPAALEALNGAAFDLVLLDIEMPRMSGLEVLRRVRERHSPTDLPIVMVSGRQDSESVVSALEQGANDYITKPIDFAVALARVEAQLARRRLEVTRRTLDALTGLPNRAALIEWSTAQSDADRPAAALCLNIDRFRNVNNGLGRAYGDRLLIELTARLNRELPGHARLARIHGDDFACVLHDARMNDAAACASRLVDAVGRPFELDGRHVAVTASLGVACSASARDVDELLDQADTALYRAKTLSGARWELFDPALQSRAVARLQLEVELQEALARGEFELRYEPIVDLRTRAIAGFEALVRWQHPRRGEISPLEFIPVAEETRLIVPLGRLILRLACEQLREWQAGGAVPGHFMLSVNVSARQLDEPDFIDTLRDTIQKAGADPRGLKLEITESVLMENSDRLRVLFERVRALGVQIVLDDFGTGYSSLSYLQNFSVNALKIDRSFVQRLGRPGGAEIVRTLVQLARTLGMEVIAEGVDDVEQIDELLRLDCRDAQGYFFSRPLPAMAATAAVQTGLDVPQWGHAYTAQEAGSGDAASKDTEGS